MKKKILAFIFSLCLIIPCMFIFSACGDNPPTEDPTKWKTVTEATCTEKGKKQRTIDGNLEEEEIPALGHNYGEWITTLNETCTTNGSKQHTCGRCQNIETETILAHHTLDGTTKFDEAQHWDHCTKCTEKVNAEEHDLEIISTPNNLLFDSYRYIGETQHITCNDCNIEIDKKILINNNEGTLSSSTIGDVSYIYVTGGTGSTNKFHYYDFMRNVPIELCYDKYLKAGNYSYYLNDDNYNISYNEEEKIITYLNEEDVINTLTGSKGIRVYLNDNNEPQRVAIILKSGEEYEDGAYFQIEKSESIVTYKIFTEATDALYSSYTFDVNNNLINSYSNNGSVVEYNYTYDEYGFLTKIVYVPTNDVREEYKNCTYDSNGNRTGFDYYVSGVLKYSVSATFNANNQIIGLHYEFAPNNMSSYYIDTDTEFVYDNNGKLCGINRESTYYNDSTSTEETVTKSYICQYTEDSFKIIESDNAENYYLIEWTETTTTNIPE